MTRFYTSTSQSVFALVTSAALCAASFIASSPTVAKAAEVNSVTVSTAGYDLSKPSHAKKFSRVIKAAATRACGGAPNLSDLQATTAFRACRKNALASAAGQISNPVVTAELNIEPTYTRVATR